MLYDIVDNPSLTAKAAALDDATTLEAQALLAETVLGLKDPAFTAPRDVARCTLAVVLQVNFQVEQGISPFVESSVSGTQMQTGVVYRTSADDVNGILVHPQAAALVAAVMAEHGLEGSAYLPVRSVRGMHNGIYRKDMPPPAGGEPESLRR